MNMQEKETINTALAALANEYKALRTQLADVYYGGWKAASVPFDKVEAICQQMLSKEMQAREQQDKLRQLDTAAAPAAEDGTVLCECGAKNASSSNFCYICGRALKK